MSFFSTLLLVTNGFFHRYLQLCREDVFRRYSSKGNTTIAISFNIAVLLAVLVAIYVTVWPSAHFKELVRTIEFFGLDLGRTSFIGFSIKHSITPMNMALIFNVMVLTGILLWIDILCAGSINAQLRSSAFSNKLRSLQRQMFILLLLQAAAPIIFLQIPYAIAIFYLFTGHSTTPFISVIIGVLLALHPLIDPMLVLAFVKDYRIYILSKLNIRKSPKLILAKNNKIVADEIPKVYIGPITAISS
ncbi:unnamed protein product [Cylicocyclus nassatus]|uniref:G protein-coupled receptor n=1 Tax=Cylicocyclus nassatus TaxID=53992 RepID=A0AA36MCT5_CYLNA|nr:unnamed protein product [Cylicocyclus nassatus]